MIYTNWFVEKLADSDELKGMWQNSPYIKNTPISPLISKFKPEHPPNFFDLPSGLILINCFR